MKGQEKRGTVEEKEEEEETENGQPNEEQKEERMQGVELVEVQGATLTDRGCEKLVERRRRNREARKEGGTWGQWEILISRLDGQKDGGGSMGEGNGSVDEGSDRVGLAQVDSARVWVAGLAGGAKYRFASTRAA